MDQGRLPACEYNHRFLGVMERLLRLDARYFLLCYTCGLRTELAMHVALKELRRVRQ